MTGSAGSSAGRTGRRNGSPGGITDEAWADAARHYAADQLAALASLIAFMNAVNRVNVIVREPAGGSA